MPYAALAYLAGECNYGGRCTDDKDRRCLVNIISEFYNPQILDDDHRFSQSGTYYAPPIGGAAAAAAAAAAGGGAGGQEEGGGAVGGDLQAFRDYIKTLPYSEGPEVFGLHDNANIR